ncbi:hypothetical protein A2U01_0117449 [Trifolium medium]|uniref:Uncharacterized protein n=1 Tax=Trifolium medium TaxID=97028 RepID=A0A392W8P2_9FABA|nr:hypothetical protein [Trifolium medium]
MEGGDGGEEMCVSEISDGLGEEFGTMIDGEEGEGEVVSGRKDGK